MDLTGIGLVSYLADDASGGLAGRDTVQIDLPRRTRYSEELCDSMPNIREPREYKESSALRMKWNRIWMKKR